MLKDVLKSLREKRGITKRELCEKTGISERAYLTYEFGEREPKASVIATLADFYGVTTDYILERNSAEQDPVEDLSKKIGLSPMEKAIVAAYMAFDAEDRRKLVTMVQGLSNGVDDDVKKSMTVTTQTGTDKDKMVSDEEAAAKDA